MTDPLSPSERLRLYGPPTNRTASDILTGPKYDARAHYQRIKAIYDEYPYRDSATCDDFTDHALTVLLDNLSRKPNTETSKVSRSILDRSLRQEGFYQPTFDHRIDNPPTPDWVMVIERPRLDREEQFFTNWQDKLNQTTATLIQILIAVLNEYAPEIAFAETIPTAPTLSFIQLARAPAELVQLVAIHLVGEKTPDDQLIFPELNRVVWRNICEVSGYTPDEALEARNPKIILPEEADLPPAELCTAYLKNTPFLDLLLMPVPFVVPEHLRFSHTHIIGGAGHGKTQLIQTIVLDDLAKPDPPAIIIVEPKGTLIERVQRLALFAPGQAFSDKIMIVNPQDVAYPPALNLFDPAEKRFQMYSEENRRLINNQTVALYHYIFGSIATALTQKQATAFGFIVRLMFEMASTPNVGATIHTLLELVEERADSIDRSQFAPFIGRLDYTARRFFEHHFFNRNEFGETKQQIAHRLYSLLQFREFDAMFAARERKLDMFDVIQSGKIVLVNTAKGMLGPDGSSLLGRFIIAQVLAAAFERVAHPKDSWRPAFLFVDEAQDYFDDKTEELLDQAREFRVGITVAHQRMEGQVSEALASALATNTAIKYAGGLSYRDASFMARNMHCDPEFILAQQQSKTHTQFACFVRGLTPNAISVTIPLGALEGRPQLTAVQHAALLDLNRRRISSTTAPEHAQRPVSPPARQSNELPSADPAEPSTKW